MVYISYYVGAVPVGQVIGAPVSILFGSEQPVLPLVGSPLQWRDTVAGITYRGEVARSGVVEIIDNGAEVTLRAQIDCVNSVAV